MNNNNSSNKALWIVIAVLAILAITGISIYALYVKKQTHSSNVSDKIFDVMTGNYDWFAENYGIATVANGRNDQQTAALNGKNSSGNGIAATVNSFV